MFELQLMYFQALTISNKARLQVSTGQIVSLMSTEAESFNRVSIGLFTSKSDGHIGDTS